MSNKGQDKKNWNLELSWKEHGEGHEKHFDCEKFNPPDFMSKERDCKVENVKFCHE